VLFSWAFILCSWHEHFLPKPGRLKASYTRKGKKCLDPGQGMAGDNAEKRRSGSSRFCGIRPFQLTDILQASGVAKP
jgi:hypothetical protein